jgi:hypothetical protein
MKASGMRFLDARNVEEKAGMEGTTTGMFSSSAFDGTYSHR